MNVIVEYPEDCLLRPVERQVFSRQIRNLLTRDKAYMHDLDAMRARVGLEAAFHSYQREELATLLSMVHENVSDEVRDTLLERLGSYLNVRIRRADYTQETADHAELAERGEPTHAWSLSISVGIVMFAVGFGFAAALTPTHPPLNAGTRSAVAPESAAHANPIAQPLIDSTSDESVGDIPMLKFSFESSRPKRDLGALRALMPTDDGMYTIDLTVTPVVAAPAAASRNESPVHAGRDEHQEPKKDPQ
ncbi:hypothetical protein I6G56_00755 (plasmid) [Burkholderia humptydooensis]|uniref:Uncharacterized protein n=2 Tax=Burkholderia humptydooensis TaxID=430531 RepID=A0A7U4P7S0_9BURK|nr:MULTISPECIES: hypothetical protein [Burkholderia]AJY38212.1 hypothetical protein BW21_6193 [Burkholderia sp. 2002721687]ALX44544.1 hypothetical protein AQ610_18500 [Burkholderia humptydooensis]EIP85036.1 hypothetical protein A33K_18308 [Burkholderia humptydooensis MSMB43]QPS42070.1 hypothetical protein I6G56_00755 [Burkholderia humptydooensis]